MSIRAEINLRIAEGRLFRLPPRNVKDVRLRTVLVSEEINHMVSGPWPDGPVGARCAHLRNDLEAFISSEFITVCWKPYKAYDEQVGRLDAHEVWEVRCRAPRPSLRIFCRFAEKDVLVALTCSPRWKEVSWLHRLPLLGRESDQWKGALAECQSTWNKLFPMHSPFSGNSADDYITNAVL
jgi:hypothetical protein